jgi:hypothetical protein
MPANDRWDLIRRLKVKEIIFLVPLLHAHAQRITIPFVVAT